MNWMPFFLAVALLAGCASPAQIEKQAVAGRFESKLSAKRLAGCIDTNGENLLWAGAFRSKTRDVGDEPIVVVVEEVGNKYVAAVVHVFTRDTGSLAEFRFGGAVEFDEKIWPGKWKDRLVAG